MQSQNLDDQAVVLKTVETEESSGRDVVPAKPLAAVVSFRF